MQWFLKILKIGISHDPAVLSRFWADIQEDWKEDLPPGSLPLQCKELNQGFLHVRHGTWPLKPQPGNRILRVSMTIFPAALFAITQTWKLQAGHCYLGEWQRKHRTSGVTQRTHACSGCKRFRLDPWYFLIPKFRAGSSLRAPWGLTSELKITTLNITNINESKPAACKAALCGPRFSLQPLMMHFSEFLPVFKQLSLIHANATVSTVKKTLKSSALASSLLQFGLTSVYLFLWVEHLGFVKCIILGWALLRW